MQHSLKASTDVPLMGQNAVYTCTSDHLTEASLSSNSHAHVLVACRSDMTYTFTILTQDYGCYVTGKHVDSEETC